MAYGKKYILSFISDRGNDYRVDVLQQGYTGAAFNKAFGAAPVLNIEDGDGRVKGSSLAFSIQADAEGELSGLYTTNNKEYKVLLYRNNSLYWQGYLLPELYAENYVDPPYDVEVTATDQLATLKDVAYNGEDVQTSLLDIIKGILLNTQLDIPCKIHMQLTTAQGALLSTSYISAAAYNGQSCYDVLNAILLSCNCSIMQMANEWVIASLTDATTSYTTDAGVVNVPHCTIGQMGQADVCPEGSLIMINAPALKGAIVEYNHSLRNSMLINANCVNRDGWRYVPGGVQDRFPGEIDMGDAIYKCYFWLLKQKNLQQDNALQIWQDVELAHDVDNAYTLSFKYMFMSEADSLLLSVAYGTGDGTTLYLTTSGWKTGLDRYNINSYIQITGKNGNYGSVRELADTSKYESTAVKFMLPDKPGALRIGFINCTSDYSDPFFTRDILVTDVYLTVDNVTGKTSTTLVEPNATSAQEEVAIVYGEPIVTVNADKLDLSYLRYESGAAVESVYLSGKEYSSYYLAMVQEFARYYGVKKMQLQGALMGADVLHPLYADVHSGKVMRLVNGQYNLLEDSVSVSLEEVPSAFVEYELVVYAKENTPEKNTTTSAGVAVGGGGGESYLALQGDGDVYVKQERSLVGKEARFDNVALPVAAPERTAENTYLFSSDPAGFPAVDVIELITGLNDVVESNKELAEDITELQALGLSLVVKDGKTYVRSKYNFYSDGGLTAGGIGSGGGGGTGGGSNVAYRGEYTSGILLGKVTIDGVAGNIYAPSALSAYSNDVGYITSSAIPSHLPNPYALTINGTSYDGSAPVDITISGGSGGFNGGTITGKTTISTSGWGNQLVINRSEGNGAAAIAFSNVGNGIVGYIGIGGTASLVGTKPFYEDASGNSYLLLHDGNYSSYALPLSGGTIKNNMYGALEIKRLNSVTGFSAIKYTNDAGVLGYIGVGGTESDFPLQPTFYNGATSYGLIHSGNIGSYKAGDSAKLGGIDADRYMVGYSPYAVDADYIFDLTYHSVANGFHLPSNSQYGSLLTMPYRKPAGNSTPDFGTQIFIPNGDDAKPYMWFRTSLRNTWNSWRKVVSEDVNGDVSITRNLFASGGMTSGKASDRRLKQNIMNLQRTNAVNVLRTLRPVTFEWNTTAYSLDKRNNGVDVGFIADEYEGLIPNSGRAIWDKYRAIEYEKCIPHLVLGWQIHDDRFVIHEDRFETVEERLAKAEDRIKELEEELKQYKTAA